MPIEQRPPHDRPLRILLVEDSSDDAELIRRELEVAGLAHTMQRVETQAAFLDALRTFVPDIILSDFRLPQFDGLSAIHLLQDMSDLTPVILVTGSLKEETAVACIKAGAADYVLKDRLARLVPAVEAALERRRAEEERERALEALRRSETKYRSLVENASYGIYHRSADGRFLSANPALVTMLGCGSEAEVMGLDIERDVCADPGDFERMTILYHRGEPIQGEEVRWRRKDGGLITVRLSGRPVRDPDGTENHAYEMIAEDVTERWRLEAQLRQAQKMEAIGQLTGGIAHDFNNILTVIAANTEIAAVVMPPEMTELRAGLDDVRAAARRGTAMIKKLMSFSRRSMLEPRPLDLPQLIAELTGVLRRLLPEHIEIQVRSDSPVELVNADAGAVEQILINLATNARDAMANGGTLRIGTERTWLDAGYHATHPWCEPGQYVCIAVADTGVGMSQETVQRIFEPFFTTKPAGLGTGLGMAMVYGLMKQHNGYVNVYSEPDRGTTIKLYFPVARTSAQAQPAAASRTEARGGSETILVVEDEEAIRRATKRALGSHGYQVVLAADGEEALDILRRSEARIDLVVSDLVMPKLGGRQLYEAVANEGKIVRFLFTSGYSPREVSDGSRFAPHVPLLHKPWTLRELLIRVREVLDHGPQQPVTTTNTAE